MSYSDFTPSTTSLNSSIKFRLARALMYPWRYLPSLRGDEARSSKQRPPSLHAASLQVLRTNVLRRAVHAHSRNNQDVRRR